MCTPSQSEQQVTKEQVTKELVTKEQVTKGLQLTNLLNTT